MEEEEKVIVCWVTSQVEAENVTDAWVGRGQAGRQADRRTGKDKSRERGRLEVKGRKREGRG